MKQKLNTTYIIIGVVALIGILVYVFRDSLFGKKNQIVVVAPSPKPAPKPEKKPAPEPAPEPEKKPSTPVSIPTDEEITAEVESIKAEMLSTCGGVFTSECFAIIKNRLPKLETMIRIKLTEPTLSEEDKKGIKKVLDIISMINTVLTDEFFEANLRGKTFEEIGRMFNIPV